MPSSIKKMIAFYSAIIFFVGLDRFLKVLAQANPQRQVDLIGEILKFKFAGNYQIAFSLPLAGPALLLSLILIILILIWLAWSYWLKREQTKFNILLIIILGAASNLFDRLKDGYVVDYLDLKYFTVFNLADAMIVGGVFLLLLRAKETA